MTLGLAVQILSLVSALFDVAKGVHMIQGWIARGKDSDPLEGGHLETLRMACPAAHKVLTANLNAFQQINEGERDLTYSG